MTGWLLASSQSLGRGGSKAKSGQACAEFCGKVGYHMKQKAVTSDHDLDCGFYEQEYSKGYYLQAREGRLA